MRSFVVFVLLATFVLCVTGEGKLFASSNFADFVCCVKLDETSLRRRSQRMALEVQLH